MSATIEDTRLDLEGRSTILVKFTFNNSAHLPPGIPLKERMADPKMDVKHSFGVMRQALKGEIPQETAAEMVTVGRHREGRVDTGVPVIRDLHDVQVALLRRGLALKGFYLTDIHRFEKERNHGKAQQIVVCVYTRGEPTALTDVQTSALRSLASSARWTCHVWSNPNGLATINMVGRSPDRKAAFALRIRDNAIVAMPVTEEVTESEE